MWLVVAPEPVEPSPELYVIGAGHVGYHLATIDFEENGEEWWFYSSTWMLLSRDERVINSPPIHTAASNIKTNQIKIPLWTDDYASMFKILQ